MLLKYRLEHHGTFLFRWRSFLPLVLLIPAFIALPQSGYSEVWLGEAADEIWTVFAVFVAFAGLAIRVATVGFVPAGTSGRNTRAQRAAMLNTTGPYSIVRNPLYLGNMITLLGFALAFKVWWLTPMVIPLMLLYYERIIYAEEVFLAEAFGAAYESWAAKTPALVPNFRSWHRPTLPFSLRTVLRREYHGFFLIVTVMTLIEAASDVIGEGEPMQQWARDDLVWPAAFMSTAMTYLVIRTIRKKTTWLTVPGR